MPILNENQNVQSDVFKRLQDFGRFQTLQYILICLPLFVVAMTHMNYVFVAEKVDYRCRVPECEDANSSPCKPSWWPANTEISCFKPVINIDKYNAANQTCSNTTFHQIMEECTQWIYESNNSIVSGLDLGCEAWKASLVGSVHNAGMMGSMMIAGWISDKIGRKPTLIACSVGGAIGVLKIFVKNYYLYLGVEFLESFLASGLYTVGVVLLIEVGGETKRVWAGVIFAYATYVGEVVFALSAMGLQYWKSIILVVYSPLLLFLSYAFVLKEGTRWQMLSGKIVEAKDTFKTMARMNKLNIHPEEIDALTPEEMRLKFNVVIQKKKENVKDILRSKEIMVRLAVMSFCYFTSGFLYYGLVVHSVLLPGNKYTNFVLGAVTSFPGDILGFYMFNRFGRRITLQWGYCVSALFLIAQTYSPQYLSWLKVVLFMCGKLFVVVCSSGVYTYSMELFPTSVRGSLVGCANTASRIGSMLSPLTPLLIMQLTALPSILFSSAAALAAVLLIFTPETKHLPMYDTIAQIEGQKLKYKTHL